jgi:hypothetical protein
MSDTSAARPSTPEEDQSLGLLAGAGRFPFMVAQGARNAGVTVHVVALRGLADPALNSLADTFTWSGIAKLGHWIRVFRRRGVRQAIMAGFVHKEAMYGRFRLLKLLPDWESARLWFFGGLPDKRNDTVLSAVADTLLAKAGVEFKDVTQYCPESLATKGHLAGPPPSDGVESDIQFGWRIAKEIARLDIGQSLAVKETEVIAVEAIEGTDRMIERAGALCKRGRWTLIKVAKPNQDMRFDVPTIGPDTIDNLANHGASALVIQAGKTVIVDQEETSRRAGKRGVTVFAVEPGGEG